MNGSGAEDGEANRPWRHLRPSGGGDPRAPDPSLDDMAGGLTEAESVHTRDPQRLQHGRGDPGELGAGVDEQRLDAPAIVGALLAMNPANAPLIALGEEVPKLAAALPPVITACGAILAAVSEPPGARRK